MTLRERMRRAGFVRTRMLAEAGIVWSWIKYEAGRPVMVHDHGVAMVGGQSDYAACWPWWSSYADWLAGRNSFDLAQRAKAAARKLAKKRGRR